jgi:coat protein Gp5
VSDQLLTINMITREAQMVMENELTFAKRISRRYDSSFAKTGAKIGSVLNLRLPPRYVATSGQGLQLQDVTETSVPLTLTNQAQRAFQFTSADLALSVDDFSKRFVKPAIVSMANQVDSDGLALYKTVYNVVGTPGTVPNAALTYLNAGVLLDNNATPVGSDRSLCINPLMQATVVNALTNLFNPTGKISSQYEKGKMSTATLGFDWYMDQNVKVHQVGPQGGSTPNVSAVPAQGATSITTAGWTAAAASRLVVGDVFTLGAGGTTPVNGVNPVSGQSTGALQQFVVTAPFSSDGSGNGTINFAPAIQSTGAFATVTQLPTTGSTNGLITVLGAANTASPQGLAFHKDAFTMASADLPLPQGVDMADRVSDDQLGISIRLIRDYDINTDRYPLRIDFLYGYAAVYPQWACRIAS